MPTNTSLPSLRSAVAEPAQPPVVAHPHGELDCVDAEALLAEANEEITRLRAENADLLRRLLNATEQKNLAIDEAVMLRG